MSEMISIKKRLPEKECVVAVTLEDCSKKYRYYNPNGSVKFPFGFYYIHRGFSWLDDDVVSWRYLESDEKYNLDK